MRIVQAGSLALWLTACDSGAAPRAGSAEGGRPQVEPVEAHGSSHGQGDMDVEVEVPVAPTAQDAEAALPDSDAASATVAASVDADSSASHAAQSASQDAGSARDAAGAAPAPLVFSDPTFFSLPINSIRYGVSGYDPASALCISVIWYLHDLNETRFCDRAELLAPYVVIEKVSGAGCWGYAGNAEITGVRGCADFGMLHDLDDDQVALEVDVKSNAWSGTVRFQGAP